MSAVLDSIGAGRTSFLYRIQWIGLNELQPRASTTVQLYGQDLLMIMHGMINMEDKVLHWSAHLQGVHAIFLV